MYKLFTFVSVLFMLVSCSSDDLPYSYLSDPDVEAETVEFKYAVSSASSELKQTFQAQEMYIVWGDGTAAGEYVFRGNKDSIDVIKPISHVFVSEGVYDVKIRSLQLRGISLSADNAYQISELKLTKGDNLLRFSCDSQSITELDFSECPEIEQIVLSNNLQLNGTGLDRMFESLPTVKNTGSDTQEKYIIVLNGNQGDRDCDRSIAVSKGWIFRDSL